MADTDFGKLLGRLLTDAGKNQKWLAEKMKVDEAIVSHFVTGVRLPADENTVYKHMTNLFSHVIREHVVTSEDQTRDLVRLVPFKNKTRAAMRLKEVLESEVLELFRTQQALDRPRYKTRWGTELIGREKDIEAIMKLLLEGDNENGERNAEPVRFLTLVGLPGVGKSELALQIEELAQEQKHFTYVKFLGLETVLDVAIAQRMIATYLRSTNILVSPNIQKRTLLILDNCEQLINLLDYLYMLVRQDRQLTILATSRAIFSKKKYAVLPLAIPPTKYETLEQLQKYVSFTS